MKKITINQIITILATILTITMNGLATALPLNNQTTGEISDSFPIYFVPAGYVFSIWGLIYIGLIGFTIYQALPTQRDNQLLIKIYPAYWIGNLANSAWIFLWHYEYFPLTLIAMLTLLGTLLFIYIKVKEAGGTKDQNQKWFINYPFSIYLGWISVATIANVSQVLFDQGWGGWWIAPQTWAVIMITVATVLGLLMHWRENDWLYVLVIIWAFVGIANSQADTASIVKPALAASGLLGLAIIMVPFLRHRAGKGVQ